jgi:hypothetical protein
MTALIGPLEAVRHSRALLLQVLRNNVLIG